MAHESRPVYVHLSELNSHQYRVRWKTPLSVAAANSPQIALPESCGLRNQLSEFHDSDGIVRQLIVNCPEGLAGQTIVVVYPAANPSISSFIHYEAVSGERHSAVLGPQESAWTIPETETTREVIHQYLRLGMHHIWSGIDHLLFLACLVLIAGDWRRTLVTITGFTFAHSITLVASALQIVQLPAVPVEVTIALSILFVAVEVAKGRRSTLTWNQPIAVSSSFGLLHGFGFASALAEVGLPQVELVTGLLFFNVGVEIGQVLFVLAMLLLMRALRVICSDRILARPSYMRMFPPVAGYIIGVASAFWLIQRGQLLFA